MKTNKRDNARWRAVLQNDLGTCLPFLYAVRTTGIYCRPECRSRRPLRENVCFFETPGEAERAGFRACKRCCPNEPGIRIPPWLSRVCRSLSDPHASLTVAELAAEVGCSEVRLRRQFKDCLGISPKQYQGCLRRLQLQETLQETGTVHRAIHAAGYPAANEVYAHSDAMLGMSPGAYARKGAGMHLRYASRACTLGWVLVATTERGIAAVLLGDEELAPLRELEERFSSAALQADDGLADLLELIVHAIEHPGPRLEIPLDLRGTAFQQRVWQALREIPRGETRSYSELAAELGTPDGARAVAGACAANRLAVLVPCHRVVTEDGRVSGYRWGPRRKQELLRREKRDAATS